MLIVLLGFPHSKIENNSVAFQKDYDNRNFISLVSLWMSHPLTSPIKFNLLFFGLALLTTESLASFYWEANSLV